MEDNLLKFYAVADQVTNAVHIQGFPKEDTPVFDAGSIVKQLEDGQSTLALRYILKDGAIVDNFEGKTDEEVLAGIKTAAEVVMTLEDARRIKLNEIWTHFNKLIDDLRSQAAEYEVTTWEPQRTEYAAWLADKTAPTPYVTTLAAARNITVDELMAKIGVKVQGLAYIQGTQHSVETKVAEAKTVEEVMAITMPL